MKFLQPSVRIRGLALHQNSPPAQAGGLFLCFRTRNRTGRRAAARKKQSSGLFFSPREIPVRVTPSHGPFCRPWNISAASVRGSAAQATAASGGNREPEQGQRPQSASGNPRRKMRVPRLVTGRCAGDSRTGHAPATGILAGRGTYPQLPYEEVLRRRPPPAAETGSRSRASGRRVQAGNRAAGCGCRGS